MKEKVKHANLFQLALKITIGWFLEDILNYQTQISTRRSAKTICWKPSNFVTKTRLCQPAKNLHSLRLTVRPLKIGRAPKKKIHLPTIAFQGLLLLLSRRDMSPHQKICNFSFIVQCWKSLSPFSRHSGENDSRFNGESRRWDSTWSFWDFFSWKIPERRNRVQKTEPFF